MDKEMLQKSQIHSESLLKMVKTLNIEKQQLQSQITSLKEKLNAIGEQNQESYIEQNAILQLENMKLASQYNELTKQYQVLEEQNKYLSLQQDQLRQSKERSVIVIKEKDQFIQRLQELQEINSKLSQENEKLKSEKEQLLNEIITIEELYKKAKSSSNLSMTMSINNMEQSSQLIAQNDYSKSQILFSKSQMDVKLFEEFYIVSIPNTSIKYDNQEPMVLFKHPISSENNLKPFFSVLPLFSFPHGVKCSQSQQQKQDISRLLQDELNEPLDFTIQVFTPNKASGTEIQNSFIQYSNPDQLLYAIIIHSKDFIADKKLTNSVDLVKQKKLGNLSQNIYKSDIAFVILTYYPYHKLFYDIMTDIIRTLKQERLGLCKQIIEQEQDLREIDQFYFTNYENEIRRYLQLIQSIQKQSISKPIKSFSNSNQFNQNTLTNSIVVTFEVAPGNLLSGWSAANFITVFSSLILEQKVAIQGSSRLNIAYLMILFSLSIKPLKYYHPFILDVPEKLMPLLEAPVPVFLGLPIENFNLELYDVVQIKLSSQGVKVTNFERINSILLLELENQLKPIFQNNYQTIMLQIEHFLKILRDFMRQVLNKAEENQLKDVFLQKLVQTQIFQISK